MIANNYEALRFIREILDEPLTPDAILTLHSIVVQDIEEDGNGNGLRKSDDTIRVLDGTHTRILHTPPLAAEIPERLQRLCRFANQTAHDEPFLHPVLRAILLHFQLAYDHPFTDGNGRTARALFYWSLIRQGCWLAEYFSISSVLKKAPAQYGRASLYTETDDNDTMYFIIHQLDVIERAIQALHEYLARKTQEVRKMQRLLRTSPALQGALNYRQMALLIHALKHPGKLYRIQAHRVSHNVTYETARMDLLRLVEMGLLEKLQAKRAFVFAAPEDLEARLCSMADNRSVRGTRPSGE
jgi:Fic family protein